MRAMTVALRARARGPYPRTASLSAHALAGATPEDSACIAALAAAVHPSSAEPPVEAETDTHVHPAPDVHHESSRQSERLIEASIPVVREAAVVAPTTNVPPGVADVSPHSSGHTCSPSIVSFVLLGSAVVVGIGAVVAGGGGLQRGHDAWAIGPITRADTADRAAALGLEPLAAMSTGQYVRFGCDVQRGLLHRRRRNRWCLWGCCMRSLRLRVRRSDERWVQMRFVRDGMRRRASMRHGAVRPLRAVRKPTLAGSPKASSAGLDGDAIASLERHLALAPDAPDAERIRARLRGLHAARRRRASGPSSP